MNSITQKFRILSIVALLTGVYMPLVGQTKIYIDPGHGGTDPGAVNDTFGTQEADRNLFTGLALRDYFQADTDDTSGGGEWEIRMSRTTDVNVGLTARATDSNSWGADRFFSIHQNAFNDSANGTETLHFPGSTTSIQLATIVQSEAIEAWNRTDRGLKPRNDLTVLSATSAPAVLVEMGFVDSPTDHPFCASDAQCDLFALHMLFAFQHHFGLQEFTPNQGPPPIQVVVDADLNDPGYSETGSWSPSGSTGFFDEPSRFASVEAANTATFTPNLPESGEYRVEAWWIAGGNRSNGAVFVIDHLLGTDNETVSMETNGSQWNSLGDFEFVAGQNGSVILDGGLSNTENDPLTVIIADAVRFTKVGEISVIPKDDVWLISGD